MNLGSNTQNYDSVMPLLMNYTPSTRIEESDAFGQLGYDYLRQIVPVEMKLVGTKCLRTSITKRGNTNASDRKNEIDDEKHG
jgi:hypothetical protein